MYRLAGGCHDGPVSRTRIPGSRAAPGPGVTGADPGTEPRSRTPAAPAGPRAAAGARTRPADTHTRPGAEPGTPARARSAPVAGPETTGPRPRARSRTGTAGGTGGTQAVV